MILAVTLVLATHMLSGVASGFATALGKCSFALLQEEAVNAERLQEEARSHVAATSALHQSCQQLQEQLTAQAAAKDAAEHQVCVNPLFASLTGQVTECLCVEHVKNEICLSTCTESA